MFSRAFSRSFQSLSAPDAAAAIGAGAHLIDVRGQTEWDAVHVPNAILIPLGQLRSRLSELPADGLLITVCRSGMRSSKAAEQLAATGREVANLAGGMNSWITHDLPVVRDSR